jgi:hypothetical protein
MSKPMTDERCYKCGDESWCPTCGACGEHCLTVFADDTPCRELRRLREENEQLKHFKETMTSARLQGRLGDYYRSLNKENLEVLKELSKLRKVVEAARAIAENDTGAGPLTDYPELLKLKIAELFLALRELDEGDEDAG